MLEQYLGIGLVAPEKKPITKTGSEGSVPPDQKKPDPRSLGAGCGSGYCRGSITSTGSATYGLQSRLFPARVRTLSSVSYIFRTSPTSARCFCGAVIDVKSSSNHVYARYMEETAN
jgi:hypothetical protein